MRYNPDTDYIQCKYEGTWQGAIFVGLRALYNSGSISPTIGNIVAAASNSGNPQLTPTTPTLKFEGTYFYTSLYYGGNYRGGWARTQNKVDLTNFTKLHVLMDAVASASPTNSTQGVYVIAATDDNTYSGALYEVVHGYPAAQSVANKEAVLNITTLSGFYYLGIYLQTNTAAKGNVEATVYKMWLTR